MINTEETDKCVICGNETPYTKNTHINERKFYIETAGQLCEQCYKNLYEINIKDELKEL
jgi:recombinational DNA repair protein (RecF pathway)